MQTLDTPIMPSTTVPKSHALSSRWFTNTWAIASAIFIVTRLAALLGGYLGANRLINEDPTQAPVGWAAIMALKWDGGFYVTIAQHGYTFDPTGASPSTTAFLPLYPFLIKVVAAVLRGITPGFDWGNPSYGSYVAAGLIVSNVCFFVALVLLIKLLTPRLGLWGASLAALGLAVMPTAFYFSGIYTEGLFTMLVLATFSLARSDWRWKWLCVGLVGALAVLTRTVGLVLAPAMLVEYMAQRDWNWRRARPDVLLLGFMPFGLVLLMASHWLTLGEPLAFLKAQNLGPWQHPFTLFTQPYLNHLSALWKSMMGQYPPGQDPITSVGAGSRLYEFLNLGLPLIFVLGALAVRKKVQLSEWLWLLLGIIFPLSAGTTWSLNRFVLPLWPGVIWVGALPRKWRWMLLPLLLASLALMGWCAAKQASGRWVG